MVVDPGGNSSAVIARVEQLGLPLEVIALTHGHFDHLGALSALSAAFPEAKVAIHPDDALWLGKGALARHLSFFTTLGAGGLVSGYTGELPEASLFLENALEAGGWRVLHTPGHSPGSVSLYNVGLGVLLAGDTLFAGGVGRTDGPGGDSRAMNSSLKLLLALPGETRVLSGHGPATSIARERESLMY